MKKFFTYAGKSAALLFSFMLAAIALFMLGVVISLLMNEPKQAEEEASVEQAEYIDAYNVLDNKPGVVMWSDAESGEKGKVLFIRDGTSFQFFGRSGDDIHKHRHVMNKISETMSKEVVNE
ncbi:hypothetical protein AB4027_06125 [Alkalibacterium putridalgicola]|uniref:hypothetical protein n=1 Tax=Alkalibacterium putridalgicola TaxID=426703 RepID=UPI0034CF921D